MQKSILFLSVCFICFPAINLQEMNIETLDPDCIANFEAIGSFRFYGDIKKQFSKWNRFLIDEMTNTDSLHKKMESFRQLNGIPIKFSINESDTINQTLSRFEDLDGPCGAVATIFVNSLDVKALFGDTLLGLDSVLEVHEDGEIISRWNIPYNSSDVSAIGKDELYVPFEDNTICLPQDTDVPDHNEWLAIKLDNSLRVTIPPYLSDVERIECQDIKESWNSVFVGCYLFEDIITGKKRILVFQSPCT